MFSTVDSPSARFLKIYLVSENGELAARLPSRLRRLERITRTVPTQENLDLLAQSLTEETWVQAPYPYLFYSAETNEWQQQAAAPGSGLKLETEVRTRSRRPEEPEFPAEYLVGYDSIRVELWKFHYEKKNSMVRATKQLETSAERSDQ